MDLSWIVFHLPRFLRRHKLVRMLLWMFPGSRIQRVRFNHTSLAYADISDPFNRHYFLTRTFEPEFFAIARPFLSQGGVFFDIGAHFGFCSFGLMASLAGSPAAAYYLFEANQDICEQLRRSAALYPGQRIAINHCCVTNIKGNSQLRIDHDNIGGSYISAGGGEDVSNLILDDYIEKHAIKRIDFLKMDIEGSEPFALEGARKSLTQGLIRVLYVEVSPEHLARYGRKPSDCFDLLRESGFRLFYCKSQDFSSGVADQRQAFELSIHGQPLRLAPLARYPDHHQTDILAIHGSVHG